MPVMENEPAMHDGAGQPVSQERAAEAVKWFAEMWGNALFDCGPQDYEFMAKQCMEEFQRRTIRGSVGLAGSASSFKRTHDSVGAGEEGIGTLGSLDEIILS
jgi:hypothetical protein